MSQVKGLTYIMNQLNNLEASEDSSKTLKLLRTVEITK